VLEDDGRVDTQDPTAAGREQAGGLGEEDAGVDILPTRIGRREVAADVPFADGAQDRIDNGVGEDVAVRVRDRAHRGGDVYAADSQPAAGFQAVNVEAFADSVHGASANPMVASAPRKAGSAPRNRMNDASREPGRQAGPAESLIDHEMVLASLLVGILAFGTDGRLIYVNSAAEALLGHSVRELLSRPRFEVLGETPWLDDLVDRATHASGASLRDEGMLGSDGRSQVVAVASMLFDREGGRTGTVLALHDLGRRRLLESDEENRARTREIDRMLSNVAHELNNPLSGIRGAAQMLARKLEANPELASYGQMIVRQSDRMSELIRGLMKLEAPPPAFEPVNIHRVLNEVILLLRTEAEARGVRVTTEFDPSLPEIVGREDQLQQLFLNILKNAVRIVPEHHGRVRLSTRMENTFYVETGARRVRYIAVDVVDNGPGFDEETRRRVFTPFFSQSRGGHGLGLSIARNIAIAHGGRIQAENVTGGGARFRVNLPVHEHGGATERSAAGGTERV
jgi:two-component system nitrogen regulation sensor histidine kinase GlnL